ncbi:BA75_01951T0 [Komagataella pastoris]|uniref:BA75_01951T0 n=1 Tax=Komagataella pastoris TaxID=4922 RepID=A0A1B2JAV6_PICPA|nr:BA75_01951T0 [Komagataella pastoris]
MFQIVIVGCGSYGIALANRLQKINAKITLIANSECTIFLPSTIRLPFNKDASGVEVLVKDVLNTNVELIVDQVLDIDKERIELKSHHAITYDRLVIATGAEWDDPICPDKFLQYGIENYANEVSAKIENSRDIVIVGGGIVGVEVAGEIAYHCPKKSVTLIHSKDKILNEEVIEKARDSVQSQLLDLNVNLILGKKAEIKGDSVFIDGSQIPCDHLIKATGPRANSPPSSIEGLLNERREIVINASFQTVSTPKIYAIGDVTNYPERGLVSRHSWLAVISHNLQEDINGTSNYRSIKWHESNFKANVGISVGPKGGAGQLVFPFGICINAPRFLIVKSKSATLFRDRFKSLYSS